MQENQKYFLVVAQEMNISRAAEKLFVSQQSLSYHIRQLEKEYGVELFHRTPRLRLTTAGERMLWTLRQMEMLEKQLISEYQKDTGTGANAIRLMMPEGRFRILAVPIIHEFHKKHPHITLEIHGNPTQASEKCLLDGECDVFIGINPSQKPQFEIDVVAREQALIIGRQSLFCKYIPAFFQQKRAFDAEGVDLQLLANAPFIFSHVSGVMGQQLASFLQFQQLHLDAFLKSNSSDLNFCVCQQENSFSLFSEMYLALLEQNQSDDPMLHFRIKDFPYLEKVCIVRYKANSHSSVSDDLVSIIRQTIKNVIHSVSSL